MNKIVYHEPPSKCVNACPKITLMQIKSLNSHSRLKTASLSKLAVENNHHIWYLSLLTNDYDGSEHIYIYMDMVIDYEHATGISRKRL